MKRLDILVVEDNKDHLENAVEQLGKSHNLVTATSFDGALKELKQRPFKVLLSDLMMQKGSFDVMSSKGREFAFEQLPYGFPLILIGAQTYQIPRMAIVTDMSHHDHPMAYCLDFVHGTMKIQDSLVRIEHAPMIEKNGIMVKDWRNVLGYLMEAK